VHLCVYISQCMCLSLCECLSQCVCLSSACTANDFANPVVNPANRGNNYQNLNVPSGFSLAPITSITFNARGIPDSGSDVAFTITDGVTTYNFNVDGQTGLVW